MSTKKQALTIGAVFAMAGSLAAGFQALEYFRVRPVLSGELGAVTAYAAENRVDIMQSMIERTRLQKYQNAREQRRYEKAEEEVPDDLLEEAAAIESELDALNAKLGEARSLSEAE